MASREQIAAAYLQACRAEIEALKPGNVHRFADGHRMTAQQFRDSAALTADAISRPGASIGRRIAEAATITREQIGTNTNLGILLLCAPLAKAAESGSPMLTDSIADVLKNMTQTDADDVFRAIMIANPGGLGTTEKHDVASPPQVSLLEAMAEAADRDVIARQYVSNFSDILSGGLAAFARASREGEQGMWPTVFVYLHFLSSFPDSHIARKLGVELAQQIMGEAGYIAAVTAQSDLEARERILLAFDTRLKAAGINPGTSADLTVATLFAAALNLVLQIGTVNA